MEKNPVFPFEQGGKKLVIIYDKEFNVVRLFDRTLEGETVEPSMIDVKGTTPEGKVPQVPLHNGVFWMVWSHWYPETKVYN